MHGSSLLTVAGALGRVNDVLDGVACLPGEARVPGKGLLREELRPHGGSKARLASLRTSGLAMDDGLSRRRNKSQPSIFASTSSGHWTPTPIEVSIKTSAPASESTFWSSLARFSSGSTFRL